MNNTSREAVLAQDLLATRPIDLPEFEKPPVVEVVLSLQFSELRKYRSLHAGLLWSRYRDSGFKEYSEHPPLERRFEIFGPEEEIRQPSLKLVPADEVRPFRIWFIKEEGGELIQLQADRFVHNWRKTGESQNYPRYERIKERFFEEIKELQAFFDEEGIGQIQPNQCEVTYVNLISFDGDVWTNPEAALKVLSDVRLNPDDSNARLPTLEDAQYSARFVLADDKKEPIGRLIVSAQPAISTDGNRMLRLELTARGAPFRPDLDGASQFFDFGREAVVRGFTALTTAQMHKIWRRTK